MLLGCYFLCKFKCHFFAQLHYSHGLACRTENMKSNIRGMQDVNCWMPTSWWGRACANRFGKLGCGCLIRICQWKGGISRPLHSTLPARSWRQSAQGCYSWFGFRVAKGRVLVSCGVGRRLYIRNVLLLWKGKIGSRAVWAAVSGAFVLLFCVRVFKHSGSIWFDEYVAHQNSCYHAIAPPKPFH